jgi:hypothetical protein
MQGKGSNRRDRRIVDGSINWIHMAMYDQLWNKRNEETHKVNGNRGSAREKLKAESRTRALYEQASQLIVEDRGMFAMLLDERLQQPLKSLLAWVSQVTQSVKVGLQEAQARIREKIRDIRAFFKPTILLRAVRQCGALTGPRRPPEGAKNTSVAELCGYLSISTSCAGPNGYAQNLNNTPKTPGARVGWRR